jgi:hypothetical protein
MDQDEEQNPQFAKDRARHYRNVLTELSELHVVWLRRYYPGPDFWEFVIPGRGADLTPFSYKHGYGEQIPFEYAKLVDNILIQWLTKRCTAAEAARQFDAPINELSSFREANAAEELTEMLAGFLLDSLRELRERVGEEGAREATARLIQEVRVHTWFFAIRRSDHRTRLRTQAMSQ